MIPAEAVEAAARVLHAQESLQDDVGDFSVEVYEHDMRAILEAAAPHMARPSLTPECFDQMVDAVLEHNGTPRHKLFEYPHRADDSHDMIRAAENLVRRILSLTQPK